MDAEVTVKFIIPDICDIEDFDDDCFSLYDAVVDKLNEEGYYEYLETLDNDSEIVDVKRIG
jgi:hypothetical protein